MIPVKFRYVQSENGEISDVKHIPLHGHTHTGGFGWSCFDTRIRDVRVGDDKRSISFTMELPSSLYEPIS